MADIPSTEPTAIAAGETVQWRRAFGDYLPSAGYALKYYFAGPDIFTVSPAQVNGEWLATVAPGDTQGKKPGTYRWTAYAELGNPITERHRVAFGTLTLEPNITTAAAGDLVGFAEKALPIIEAALTGSLTDVQASFQIDGTLVTRIPVLELKRLRRQLRGELWRKRNPGLVAQPIYLNFRRPR